MMRALWALRPTSRSIIRAGGTVVAAAMLGLMPLLTSAHTAVGRTASRAVRSSAPAAKGSSTSKKATNASSPAVRTASSASLGPIESVVQSLNNCGPASVAEVLAYFHIYRSEGQVAAVLRSDDSYWGMSPDGLPAYARSLDMRALVGYGGSEKLIKLLIANGFPVIVSQYVSSADPIRHYRPIEAYNDPTGTFVSADPYLGADHVISYTEFASIWAESDYRFQVIYSPSRQALLNAVLRAAGWNAQRAYTGAIAWEEAQIHSAQFAVPGSWIQYNGYADIAFDQAELGEFKQAQGTLATAARQGINGVLAGWVRAEIQYLQRHG